MTSPEVPVRVLDDKKARKRQDIIDDFRRRGDRELERYRMAFAVQRCVR